MFGVPRCAKHRPAPPRPVAFTAQGRCAARNADAYHPQAAASPLLHPACCFRSYACQVLMVFPFVQIGFTRARKSVHRAQRRLAQLPGTHRNVAGGRCAARSATRITADDKCVQKRVDSQPMERSAKHTLYRVRLVLHRASQRSVRNLALGRTNQ